jgi:LmbE family N-acetylglucosaminyl deacetylase
VTALFLSPHNDDETLFGAFVIQQQETHVVVVLRSFYEETRWPAATYQVREDETAAAVGELGATWEQLEHSDIDPAWDDVRESMAEARDGFGWDVVYAPLAEVGGHVHHNRISAIAVDVFGRRVRFYSTYTNLGRSETGRRVEPEPEWIEAKLRALACYRSQIAIPDMRPHFVRGLDEYLLP